jgi:hypothetical protein
MSAALLILHLPVPVGAVIMSSAPLQLPEANLWKKSSYRGIAVEDIVSIVQLLLWEADNKSFCQEKQKGGDSGMCAHVPAGARIASLVVSRPELFQEWNEEMEYMSGRIKV